eukprot:s9351_g2.t1
MVLDEFVARGTQVAAQKLVDRVPFLRQVPSRVTSRLAVDLEEAQGWELLKALPVNRRTRKRLHHSKCWVLSLCSGLGDPRLKARCQEEGYDLVEVDLSTSKGWDLADQGLWKALSWAAFTGRVSAVLADPPVRTWHQVKTGDGSHTKLRTYEEPWGTQGLAQALQARVNVDTLTGIQPLWLWTVASIAKGEGIPICLTAGEPGGEGIEAWEQLVMDPFARWSNCSSLTLFGEGVPQGNSEARPEVRAVEQEEPKAPAEEEEDLMRELDLIPLEEGEVRQSTPKKAPPPKKEGTASVLSEKEREGWKRHLAAHHLPFRRDCLQCVMSGSLGLQHRRVRHPAMYALSYDLAGPFKELGRDERGGKYKYALVAGLRVPAEALPKPLTGDGHATQKPSQASGAGSPGEGHTTQKPSQASGAGSPGEGHATQKPFQASGAGSPGEGHATQKPFQASGVGSPGEGHATHQPSLAPSAGFKAEGHSGSLPSMDPDEGDKGSEESYDLSEVEDQMVPQEEDTLDPLPATEEEESMDPWTIPEHVSRRF